MASQYNYFTNAEIKEIIEQYEMYVQLLIQLYLFAPDNDLRIEAKNRIERLNREKLQNLYLQGLRAFEVFLVDFKFGNSFLNTLKAYLSLRLPSSGVKLDIQDREKAITFQVAPQISVLQSPALESLNLINQAVSKNLSFQKKICLLNELSPLLQRKFVPAPILEHRDKTTSKFTPADDALLLIGLTKFGSKNLQAIQSFFLMHKSIDEIRNRFKNLTRFKSPRNPIKVLKMLEVAPLSDFEIKNLEKGKLWFGFGNYRLISRFFLPERSEEFLANHDQQAAKLIAKRSNGSFILKEQDLDSWVLDQKSDFILESEEEKKDNKDFLEFLNEFNRNANGAKKLIRSQGNNEFSFFTINVSDQGILIGNRDKGEKNLLLLNKSAGVNAKIRILDDRMIVSNQRLSENAHIDRGEEAAGGLLGLNADAFKRPKGFQTADLVTKRFCPSTKELNDLANRTISPMENVWVDGALYKKFTMPEPRDLF